MEQEVRRVREPKKEKKLRQPRVVIWSLIGVVVIALLLNIFKKSSTNDLVNQTVPGIFAGYEQQTVTINDRTFKAYIADTKERQNLGLSGIPSLPTAQGMLFTFAQPVQPAFWMKGMNFDLDFIWIADGKVVDLDKNLSHVLYTLRLITPQVPITEVLEINSGLIDEGMIQLGDEVKFE